MDAPDPVNARLRGLPSVDRLLEAAGDKSELLRWSLLAAARAVLRQERQALLAAGETGNGDAERQDGLDSLAARTRALAQELERPAPRTVINATGVVIHTNLGRAPLAPEAAALAAEVGAGYSDLEFDLEDGQRGSRLDRVGRLLELLSGAESALVVNNNAAALLLAVDTVAAGREVILSRGELVEIGGSFRVPEIMESTRARLLPVGTTNRTHLRDYELAIGPETGMLLKIHKSNFEIRGFTAEVELGEIATLGAERGIAVVEDRGSGTFLDLRPHGVPEPEAWSGLRAGADLVLFSGDKLLGGPQAGIVLGRRELVERMRRSPLARALRVDKMTLAALHWTLRAYLDGSAGDSVPVVSMLLATPDALRERAEEIAGALGAHGWRSVRVVDQGSLVGGGALPDFELPGAAVRIEPEGSAADLARALRRGEPPIVVRVQRDCVLIDPRTLRPSDTEALVRALGKLAD